VKIVREEKLIDYGKFSQSKEWRRVRKMLLTAIKSVEWPTGSGKFTIYSKCEKKRDKGNGVKPIKAALMLDLKNQGWNIGELVKPGGQCNPDDYDALLQAKYGPVVVEWETGNISNHLPLNKMALALVRGTIAAGVLVIPSREMCRYLTDRVGHMQELEPYLDFWKSIPCKSGGILQIMAIEHDATSTEVPQILKGKIGRALA
jgi:hypothetical protein